MGLYCPIRTIWMQQRHMKYVMNSGCLWQIKVREHFFQCSVGSFCLSICSRMVCNGSDKRGAKRRCKLLSQHAGQEGVPVTDNLTLHSMCFASFKNLSTNFVPMGWPQRFATVSAIWQVCSRTSAISISIYKNMRGSCFSS